MTKEQFLNDQYVSGFIQWLRDKLSNFTHSYYNQKEKEEWQCTSFYDACHKYKWGGLNWEENNALLESYAKRLKASIRNNDNEACQDACLDILKWGGVIRENQERIKAQTNLVNYLMKAEGVLTRDSLDINDFIIYDSRVGAALCYLVKLYCIEQKQGGVPSLLKFAYGDARNPEVNRNPNSDIYKFSKLDR